MRILSLFKKKQNKAISLKEEIIENRNKDIRDLKKINKNIKLLLKNGDVEKVIKDIDWIRRELK